MVDAAVGAGLDVVAAGPSLAVDQAVGFGVALTMEGRFHRRNERSTTTYLLYSEDIARLISELVDATIDADPAWRDQVLGLIRLALDPKRGEQ